MLGHDDNKDFLFDDLGDDAPEKKEEGTTVGKDEPLEGEVLDAAIEAHTEVNARADAMAVTLDWLDGEDRTADSLADYVEIALFDDSDDSIFDDDSDQESAIDDDDYSEMYGFVGQSLIELGGKPESVEAFINDDDEDAGYAVADQIALKLEEANDTDTDIISRFSLGGAIYDDAKKRVIRGGEVKFIKKRKRKKRLSGAQRAALKKARMKSHKGNAKKSRRKSMKKRKARGLK